MGEVRYRVTIDPLPILQPGQYEQVMGREVGKSVLGLVEEIAEGARQHTPVNTGLLRASIATRVTLGTPAGTLVHGEVFTGQQAPYAQFVEQGTRPHFPPRAPLELWAQRVLGDRRLWFVVARAIARRGTRARHMFREAFAQVQGRIVPTLDAAVARAARLLQGGR